MEYTICPIRITKIEVLQIHKYFNKKKQLLKGGKQSEQTKMDFKNVNKRNGKI